MYEKPRKIAVCALILQKWHRKWKCRHFFYLKIMFVFGKLGEIWAKMVLEVSWFQKIHPTWSEMYRFFGGNFVWSSFRAGLGKFGQKSFAPPKICLLLHLCRQQPEKDKKNIFATPWKNFCGCPWSRGCVFAICLYTRVVSVHAPGGW